MDRLTCFDGEFWIHKNFPPVGEDTVDEFIDCVKELAGHLAAYEDTELEPEEVERLKLASIGETIAKIKEFEDIPIDRLRELAQADRAGRCVVLPCKVGDTVWICGSERGVYSAKVRTFFIGHPSLRGSSDNSIQMVRTTECDIPTKNFGKTVFLTREEAEAASKQGTG